MSAAVRPLEASSPSGAKSRRARGVSVLLLSVDPALRAVVRTAVDERHEYQHVDSADAAVDALVASPSGVLITDLALVRGDVAGLFGSLREQFPDLVLIAAGSRDDEASVAAQLSDGTLFRFLHKPASPGRASLFVTAAIQRHQEATGSGLLGRLVSPGSWRLGHWLAVALLVLLAAIAIAWWLTRSASPGSPATRAVPTSDVAAAPAENIASLLTRARTALQEARIVAPSGDNALELFGKVLLTHPDEPEALDGMRRVVDQLLSQAEDALAAGNIDQARGPLEYVRLVKPDHPRLNFLDAQIARAQAAIDAAERAALASVETPEQVEMRRLVALADRRLASGRLVGPARDDARHYALAAAAIDPADPEVRSVAALIGASLVERGDAALDAKDVDRARRWVDVAGSFSRAARVQIRGLEALSGRVQAALKTQTRAQAARHLDIAALRLDEEAWVAPAGDSARDHLIGARTYGAGEIDLAPLEQRLLSGLTSAARTALQTGELERAGEMLEAAARLAPDDATLAEIRATLASAEARQAFLDDVVPASSLRRTRVVAANYPRDAARRGTEGYVEVRFTVVRDGSTREFEVVAAEPAGVFEEAAIEALRGWQFEPVVEDGTPVDQRASVRMKFQLE